MVARFTNHVNPLPSSLKLLGNTHMSYLAHATIGAGGSWARDKSVDKAVKAFIRIAFSDWGSLYDMAGKDMQVGIYDVGDHDVTMNHNGVFVDGSNTPLRMLECRTVTFPKKR